MVADNFGYIELSDPDAVPRDVLVHSFDLRRRGDELVASMKLMGEDPSASPLDILKTRSQEKRRAEKRVLLKGTSPILTDTPIVADVTGDMEIPLFHFAADVEEFLDNPSVVKFSDVKIQNTPREVKGDTVKFNLVSKTYGLTFSPTSAKFYDFFVGPIGDKDHRVALHGFLAEPVTLNIKGRGKVKIEPGFEMISILKGTITPDFVPSGRIVEPGTPQSATYAEVPTIPETTPSSSSSSTSTPSTSTPTPPPAEMTREQKEQKVREIITASTYAEGDKEKLIKIILLPDINPGDTGKKLVDNGVALPISPRLKRGIHPDRCSFDQPTCRLLNDYVGNLQDTFKLPTDILGGRNGFPSILDEFLRIAPAPVAPTTLETPTSTVLPTVESITSALPSVESITNALPSVESITNALPSVESITNALPTITEQDHPSTQLEREIKEKVPDAVYSFTPQPCETVTGKIDDNFVKNIEQMIQLYINNKYPGLFDEKLQREVFQDQKFAVPLSEVQTENKGQEYKLYFPTKKHDFNSGDSAYVVDVQCGSGEMGIQISIKKNHSNANGQIIEHIRGGAEDDAIEGFLFELSYGKTMKTTPTNRVQTIKTEAPAQTTGGCEKETGKVDAKLKDTVLESIVKFIEKTRSDLLTEINRNKLKENKGLIKFLEETQAEKDGKEYTLILPTAQGPTLTLSTGSHKTVNMKVPEGCSQNGVVLKVNVNDEKLTESVYFSFEFVV